MFFIGIITDKNSENNIKNIMKNRLDDSKIIFLNKYNIENFRNVRFDSLVINNKIDNKYILDSISEKSKFVLYNSDINEESKISNEVSNFISFGYNSRANVTISSVEDDNYLIFIQNNICGYNGKVGMQEIRFEKEQSNINAYDSMIATVIDLIYRKNNNK